MMGVWRLSLSSVAPYKRCLNPSISSFRLQSRPNSRPPKGSKLNQAPRLFSSLTARNASPKLRNSIFSSKRFDSTVSADAANETQPIWLRNPKDVTKEEYNEFYRNTFNADSDLLASSHFAIEGLVEFRSVLFVPTIAKNDFTKKNTKNIRLYVKHMFISDDFGGDLLPGYLSFVEGIVDSNDLPLNISKEILQQNANVSIIRTQLVRKALDMLLGFSLSENRDDYVRFWENFDNFLKIGCIKDKPNLNRIAPLLRFFSSRSKDGLISLDEYVENMKPKQKYIYYIPAASVTSAKNAPFVEKLLQMDYEVLFLVSPMDEPGLSKLNNYKEKKFINITKEDLDLGAINTKKEREFKLELGLTCDWIKKRLRDKVASVKISSRLTTSPCVLVTGKFGLSINMERLMKKHKLEKESPYPLDSICGRKIFEINPEHQIIRDLLVSFRTNPEDPIALKCIDLLYDTALVTSGFNQWNHAEMEGKIYEMIRAALWSKPIASSSSVLRNWLSH